MFSSFLRAIGVLSLVTVFGILGDENWACVGVGIGFTLHSVLTIIAAGRTAGFSASAYLAGIARPLLPCIPLAVAVVGAERLHSAASVPNAVSLVIQVVLGAIVYVVSAFVLVRSDVNELLRLGRDAVRRRRS
jgi:hypothetical protein